MYKPMYDVAVIGGGPAGSAIALRLAEKEFKVVLIEKNPEQLFWHKISDTLSPAYIDKVLDTDVREEKVFEVLEVYDDSGKSIAEFYVNILVLNRDQIGKEYLEILKDSGVHIITKTQVKTFSVSEEEGEKIRYVGCEGKFSGKITTRLIVDCSGIESIIRQELSRLDTLYRIEEHDLMHVLLDLILVESSRFSNDRISIILGERIAPLGYAWITPTEKLWRIGIAIRKSRKYPLQLPSRSFDLRKTFRVKGRIIKRTFNIFPGRRPLEKFVYDGVVLVGESALQCSPMYGGGIYGALKVAKELSNPIILSLEKEDFPNVEMLWKCEEYLIRHLFISTALELVFLYFNRLDAKGRKEILERLPATIKNSSSLMEHLFVSFQDMPAHLAKYVEDILESFFKLQSYYSRFPAPGEMNKWMQNIEKDIFKTWKEALSII